MAVATKKALSGGNGAHSSVRMMVPLAKLVPNADQVRQTWDDEEDEKGRSALDRLAESIKNQGLLQDLVVAPKGDKFVIVCGERRYRAIKEHKLMVEVPCVVREGLSEAQLLEINIVENLQREDLTPMDEARAYKALMEKCGYSQAQLAQRLGLSGAMVSYKLSLLDLSPGLQKEVARGRLSETDGRGIVQAVKRVPVEDRPAALWR
jgi:ParB family chromosome partitioning protein